MEDLFLLFLLCYGSAYFFDGVVLQLGIEVLHLLPVIVADIASTSLCLHFLQVLVQVSIGEAFAVGLVLLSEHFYIVHIVKPEY